MSTPAHKVATGLSLRANFSWTFAANVLYAASQWGMLTVLAQLGSPVMVGQFALGLAIATPVVMLTNLQLRQLQATDARGDYSFADYLGLRLLTTVLALCIIGAIIVWSGYRAETAQVVLVLGVSKAVEALSDVFYGLFQQHEQMDRIARSMIARGFIALAALGSGVWLTGSVFWGVVGIVASWLLVLVGYDLPGAAMLLQPSATDDRESKPGAVLHPRWHRATMARLTWLALPLGLVMMLISLNTSIPRYFIERYQGEYDLGIFAAIAYLMVAGTTVVTALGQSASPRLARYYLAHDRPAFRALLLKLVGIGALLGIGGVLVALLAGQQVLTLLYGSSYARADVLLLIMLAAGCWYIASCCGYAATASRRIGAQPVVLCAVTAASGGLCWYLVPLYGLWGAALALAGSSLVAMLCYAALVVPELLPWLDNAYDYDEAA